MTPEAWGLLANPFAPYIVGCLSVALLAYTGRHRNASAKLDIGKVGALFFYSAAAYTLSVLVLAGVDVNAPTLSELIETGFGESRIYPILTAAAVDYSSRTWARLTD